MTDKEIIVVKDAKQLAARGAGIFCRSARERVRHSGQFAVAVSGGTTPRALHRLLTQQPYINDVPWQKVHIFWVDERMVPFEDTASNFGAAKSDFLENLPVPAENIHPMPVWTGPQEAVQLYQKELDTFFKPPDGNCPVFDLILLGIGTDGHTASLFPQTVLSEEGSKWVLAVKGGSPDVLRITLSYYLLNQARQVVFLVSGKEKAPIVKRVLENTPVELPAQKIKPQNGMLLWVLDREAAALLPKNQLKRAFDRE